MPEPLTRELLLEVLDTLAVAFGKRVQGRQAAMLADVYREGLSGLSGDAVRAAARRAIQEDTFFPKVSRIREIASEWSRRNEVQQVRALARDDGSCAICGRKPVPRGNGRLEMVHDRRAHGVHDDADGAA